MQKITTYTIFYPPTGGLTGCFLKRKYAKLPKPGCSQGDLPFAIYCGVPLLGVIGVDKDYIGVYREYIYILVCRSNTHGYIGIIYSWVPPLPP